MTNRIAHVALIVRDYDEAIGFFCDRLGFQLLEDRPVPEQQKRFVRVGPPGGGAALVLARASTPEQADFIGNQTSGRVFLFLETDDFDGEFRRLTELQIHFVRGPDVTAYGKVAVFEDLYGNRWDLIQYV
jgi:catechol 2,3-dioxygenase-like lactoylglutathione lyase family enzyme